MRAEDARLLLAGLLLAGGLVAATGCTRSTGGETGEAPGLAHWREAAARRDVRILRDEWGMPHIYGATDPDVAFGLAYAHSEDDFRTIQEVLLASRGRFASVAGSDAAVTDYLVAWMELWPTVDARYASDVPADVRALAEAYAEGVNLYAAEHPGERLPGWFPADGRDVVAGFAFRTPFFYGLERTLLEVFGDERARAIALGPADQAFRGTQGPVPPIGSNAVAVAPSRSADGATRLLINSHQPFTGPVAWYEVRVKSEEGWDMTGGVFPGSPVVLHGTGPSLGWASTVNLPDLADVYVLDVDPDDPDRYRFEGEWRRLEAGRAEIPVRLFGPFRWTVEREVLRSVHGPAIRTDHGTYAVRYAGMGEIRQLEQYYRMNRARDFDEWQRAMRLQAIPSINFVYADRAGNVAYYYNARIPRREPGWDYASYLPGDRAELVWDEFLSWDEVPRVVSPASGFVVNANHTPFRASAPADAPDPADHPPEHGVEGPERMTNRGHRLLELYGGDASITREEFFAYKYDKVYSRESAARRVTREALALDFAGEPALQEAQRVLAAWDFRLDVENRSAALGVITATPVVVAELRGGEAPSVEEAFRDAVAALRRHHGRVDPAWGEVNRIRRGAHDLPIGGGPDVLRAAESFVLQPDGRYVANSGDTLVMFVEWDAEGRQRVDTIHQFGTATLDETSPHHADQLPLFVAERTKRIRLSEAELRPFVRSEVRPGRPGD